MFENDSNTQQNLQLDGTVNEAGIIGTDNDPHGLNNPESDNIAHNDDDGDENMVDEFQLPQQQQEQQYFQQQQQQHQQHQQRTGEQKNIIHYTLNPLILVASIVNADIERHLANGNSQTVNVSDNHSESNGNGSANSTAENSSTTVNSKSSNVSNGSSASSSGGSFYSTFTSSSNSNNNNNNSNSKNSSQTSFTIPEFENLVGTTSVVANMVSDKSLGKETSMKAVFVFSNLSVKQDGNYKLRFTLYEFSSFNLLYYYNSFVPPNGFDSVNRVIECGSIDSDVFKVYTAKKFPGLTTSSKLSFDLKSSGTKIKVRHSIRSGKKSQQAKLEAIQNENAAKAKKEGKINNGNGSANGNSQFNDYLSPNVNYNNNNNNDDTGSINSFATSASNDYLSMTPLITTMSTSSTSSLQSAAHSFGSFFSRQPEISPLKLLSDVSSQQLPIGIMNNSRDKEDNIIPSPPGSPKVDNGSTSTIISSNSNLNINNMINNSTNSSHHHSHSHSNSFSNSNFNGNLGLGSNSFSNGHHHSNSHPSRYGHQSQDSLSSTHTRHSNLSISTPTSLYFSTPSSYIKTLVNKRSDQYLNKDEEEDKLLSVPPKKSKPDKSNQYKAAIMKIQNIIN